ncbi:MAG: XdhC family protein [Alkaliphilus sp.]|nr:XdhC family protein [Alkaliphilus sp.]
MLKNLYKLLLSNINSGNQCAMLTYLDFHGERNGFISNKVLLTNEDILKKSIPLPHDIYDSISLSLETGRLQIINLDLNKSILIEPFIPQPRLIVFGGGHIAKPLSEFASRVGFSVIVIDDRPFFADPARFPEAKVICENFEKSFEAINLRKSDYVVIITRGHRHDGVVLREVLNHDLSYVGMIGSKRRVSCMREELTEEGFCVNKLNSVHAPIGLDIGAITPDEIAISIVAQLINCKNKDIHTESGKTFIFPEFDLSVAQKLYEKSQIPKALITILSTKGSVPRKAGAKMVASYDGQTVGSIGGGCSEAGVISKAREMMLSEGFFIEHIDMTGEVAESEGMVCGGVMEVLVEVF